MRRRRPSARAGLQGERASVTGGTGGGLEGRAGLSEHAVAAARPSAASHGHRSSSVRGVPDRIFSARAREQGVGVGGRRAVPLHCSLARRARAPRLHAPGGRRGAAAAGRAAEGPSRPHRCWRAGGSRHPQGTALRGGWRGPSPPRCARGGRASATKGAQSGGCCGLSLRARLERNKRSLVACWSLLNSPLPSATDAHHDETESRPCCRIAFVGGPCAGHRREGRERGVCVRLSRVESLVSLGARRCACGKRAPNHQAHTKRVSGAITDAVLDSALGFVV